MLKCLSPWVGGGVLPWAALSVRWSRLRLDGVDHVRAWRGTGPGDALGSRSRGDRRVGRQPERPRQLRRSSITRDRTGGRATIRRIRSCGTATATPWSVKPTAVVHPQRVRRRHHARPEPGVGRTATARRYGAIIPTASRVAIVRISGAWTATTTAGPANGKVDCRRPPGGRAAVTRSRVLRAGRGATGTGC